MKTRLVLALNYKKMSSNIKNVINNALRSAPRMASRRTLWAFLAPLMVLASSYASAKEQGDVDNKNICFQQLSGQMLFNCNITANTIRVSSAIVTNLTVDQFRISSTTIVNFTATNSTLAYVTSTRIDSNTVKASSITTAFFTATDSTMTSLTSTNGNITNLRASSGVVTNFTANFSTITSAVITNAQVGGSSAVFTNFTAQFSTLTNLSGTQANITTVDASSGVITNFTSNTSTSAYITVSTETAAKLSVTNNLTVPNGSAATDAAAFGQLKVVQIVHFVSSTTFSTTSSAFQSTNLTNAITPTSSSNKVLVLASCSYTLESTNLGAQGRLTLFRGTINVGNGVNGMKVNFNTISSITQDTGGDGDIIFMDTPATTSATTYTVKIASDGGAATTMYYPRSAVPCTLVLMEVVF